MFGYSLIKTKRLNQIESDIARLERWGDLRANRINDLQHDVSLLMDHLNLEVKTALSHKYIHRVKKGKKT